MHQAEESYTEPSNNTHHGISAVEALTSAVAGTASPLDVQMSSTQQLPPSSVTSFLQPENLESFPRAEFLHLTNFDDTFQTDVLGSRFDRIATLQRDQMCYVAKLISKTVA